MAMQLFASSVGLVVNKHYCQDELKSFALFLKPPSCHEQAQKSGLPVACPMHSKQHSNDNQPSQQKHSKSGCCDDTSQFVKADHEQDFQKTNLRISFDLKGMFCGFLPAIAPNMEEDRNVVTKLRYRPPLLGSQENYVLFQRFLL